MTINNADYEMSLKVKETVPLSLSNAGDATLVHNLGKVGATLDPNSTPAVSKVWSATPALTAGSLTLDLSALTNGALANVDMDTLSLVLLKIKNPAGNNTLTVADGLTNGINVFGDASGQVTLSAGQTIMYDYGSNGATVAAAGARTIDFTGTGTESFQIMICCG